MGERIAKLDVGSGEVHLDIHESTLGQPGIDILGLRSATKHVTYDPGFGNTAAARSTITFVNGAEGVLLYRGYRIEDLAEQCSFLEVASRRAPPRSMPGRGP
jgi:citrate synthase